MVGIAHRREAVELEAAMTAAQLHAALALIPGAYESTSAAHRETPAHTVAAIPLRDSPAQVATAVAPYVIAAPARPETGVGRAAAIVADVALITVIIFVIALTPALLVQGVNAMTTLVLDTWGRQ